MRLRVILATTALLCVLCASAIAGDLPIKLRKHERGIDVLAGDRPFATYLKSSGAKPVVWPIYGPTGKEMTRAYPLEKRAGEKTDHVHQRSLWFTHGDVNGISFWHEEGNHGKIVHRDFERVGDGDRGVIVTRNDWLGPDGEKLATDRRRLVFRADDERRIIDFSITIIAADKPVTFGDTKEGSFGVRVPTSMDVDSKPGGEIVNSEGQRDGKAWGQSAAWVDYHGPVENETLGIAILNHPSSFRYPTHWHVRTYGLFAANAFGLRDFAGRDDVDGSHTLQPGKSMTFHYRVVLHEGDEKQGKIAELFQQYADEQPPTVQAP